MTKIRIKSFKIHPQSREIHLFEIASLSFKIRTKIGICTLAKPHAIFQSFLLKMLDFIHTFMTSNFNPKLSRGFEAIAI